MRTVQFANPGWQMLIEEAQKDVRRAYAGGGPGVLVSGLVWLIASAVEARHGIGAGFAALFLGGVLVFPGAKLICGRLLGRAAEDANNPLGKTALESTVAMIGGLFAAWLLLPLRSDFVFPVAAMAVGTHYAVFTTVYGDRAFWLLAAAVTAAGLAGISLPPPHGWTAPIVAAVELGSGAVLTALSTRRG